MAVKLSNNATSTLSAAIVANATALTIQANDAALFPVPGTGEWFPATLVNATGAMEIIRVTARNGATMTIQRGQEGTTAKDFPVGSKIDLRLTVAALLDLPKPAVGDVNGLNDALATKLNSAGGKLTGDVTIEKAVPRLVLHYPDIKIAWSLSVTDGRLRFRSEGDGSYPVSFGTDGSVETKQIGNLKTALDAKFAAAGGTISGAVTIKETLSVTKTLFIGETAAINAQGNVVGSAWSPWGATDAVSAIGARIEARAQDWANNRILSMQYRLVSEGAVGQGDTRAPDGACLTGMVVKSGGYVESYRIRYLQIFDPVRGWIGFYNA